MQIRCLLGPAGSGKTVRCLTEIRQLLAEAVEGGPLVLVAPKQATYQLERQLLDYPFMWGYTRLQILSFERLAHSIFERLGRPGPRMLDEQGRVMVLRELLARHREDLQLYRASARLTGFAQQLSAVLGELQRQQLGPPELEELARKVRGSGSLPLKLQDLARLLRNYAGWLQQHQLLDAECLLSKAAEALNEAAAASRRSAASEMRLDHLWVDGFVELTRQELDLVAALIPWCGGATITFCLESLKAQAPSWLSPWYLAQRHFERCRRRLAAVPSATVSVELLPRCAHRSRFGGNPVLAHLEKHWDEPAAYATTSEDPASGAVARTLRVVCCTDPEAEVRHAAREILRYARAGGRFREVAILVRRLEPYHAMLQRVLGRYGVPFFLDRRESVAHHPLAELTRSALRTVAFQWQQADWFAALKTGLIPAEESDIDRLENESLARGWRGSTWQQPIVVPGDRELTQWLGTLQPRLLPPFQRLALALAVNKPAGPQLASALRLFWGELGVRETLEAWASTPQPDSRDCPPGSVHATVWTQLNAWLDNLELAFPSETLSLREWLPILDAGLASLTVGVIPPALDQVLIGAVDRSRNPEIKLALVLGLNEGVFPAPVEANPLLTDHDRLELDKHDVVLGSSSRHQLSRERFLGYLACTRSREQLVLSHAARDADGTPLNPSPLLGHLRLLFPSLATEALAPTTLWESSEHPHELVSLFLKLRQEVSPESAASQRLLSALSDLPGMRGLADQLDRFRNPGMQEALSPQLAAQLYGPVLRTSVSRMEQFAACPFRFFVHSGLGAQERRRFELDLKEQGTFQHDVLALFHEQLRQEGKRWGELTPAESRQRVAVAARSLIGGYRDGLLQATEQTRFQARVMIESLQDFVAVLVEWMHSQYRFEPFRVELPFGEDATSPAWSIPLPDGHRLELVGRIDRIDLCHEPGDNQASCVVVDYKSSPRQLDDVLVAHGVQLQLLAYLAVLRNWPNPAAAFGVSRLVPAGVFYVSLRGQYERARNRREALRDTEEARRLAYRHTGRFDVRFLRLLDARTEVRRGDQFNYRLTNGGELHKRCRDPVSPEAFAALLESVEANLKRMGQELYRGAARVDPYRKATVTACDQCDYKAICRVDAWTHRFRLLGNRPATAA